MNDSQRDDLLIRLDENMKSLVLARDDHGDRITSLEHSRTRQRGVITTVTTVVSAAWAVLLTALGVYWSR
jgi:hypothetical protein